MPYLGLDALPTIQLPPASGPDQATITPRGGAPGGGLRVQATSGALVGPPWQRRENGYVLTPARRGESPSVYIEPHVEFDGAELARLAPVDAVITPVSGQRLPGFELVHGPHASAELVRRLRPRWVLPMRNGAVDASGLSAPLISEVGTGAEFESRLRAENLEAEVVDVRPGAQLTLRL